ncbi:MAG: hypothetical protein KatS3mg035_0831 [Bacteroidia bacterium]|nr:MAG: hypothetical protein KatS3mg035_0831 [Bacteroidia bacterium]
MKKYFLTIFVFIVFISNMFAQNQMADMTYVLGDLEKMDKLQLTKVYLSKYNRLVRISPYMSFGVVEPKDTKSLRIPSHSINEKNMANYKKKEKEFNKVVEDNLYNIIPYSDKKDIMDAIMFMQETIQKIESMSERIRNANMPEAQ